MLYWPEVLWGQEKLKLESSYTYALNMGDHNPMQSPSLYRKFERI